jgi:hypothetical protein
MEEDAGVHRCFKKIHCNLKSTLSFALSKLVTTIVLQPKSPIPTLPSDERGKLRHKTGY